MNIAIDVYYGSTEAKCVGVLFNWLDEKPVEIITTVVSAVAKYEPGSFYKRELPCIMAILNIIDKGLITTIIVDGYVYIDNKFAYGLGAYVWEETAREISVIGIAKRRFFNNEKSCTPVLRGGSKVPLYVSAIGTDVVKASDHVKNMKGNYRIPSILKSLDTQTRT